MASTDFKGLFQTAREQFRIGNFRAAEQLLAQLLMMNDRFPEVYHMLATIYYDQGKFNKAIKTFRRALEVDPTFTDAAVGLSVVLNDLGRYEEGQKVFQEAQQALRKKTSQPDNYVHEKLALKHDELGEMYFQARQYAAAMEQYLKALELSARKPELRMKVIECLTRIGDHARAHRELEALVLEFPNFAPARLKLGLSYYQGRNIVRAIEQWETVLSLDPSNPVALRYLQMAQGPGSSVLT